MVADGETGFMVAPGDLSGLTAGIVRLVGDPDLRQRLGAAAAERVRTDFSIEGHVDAMERILSEAVAR
jgi:glycosyltransferase involved in cell wall biosynthesis